MEKFGMWSWPIHDEFLGRLDDGTPIVGNSTGVGEAEFHPGDEQWLSDVLSFWERLARGDG